MDKQAGAFKLSVSAADIADLRERLGRTRFPDQAPGPAWEYGDRRRLDAETGRVLAR